MKILPLLAMLLILPSCLPDYHQMLLDKIAQKAEEYCTEHKAEVELLETYDVYFFVKCTDGSNENIQVITWEKVKNDLENAQDNSEEESVRNDGTQNNIFNRPSFFYQQTNERSFYYRNAVNRNMELKGITGEQNE